VEWFSSPWECSPGKSPGESFVRPIVGNPRKGSGVAEGQLNKEGEHFLGFYRYMGNEGLWDRFNNGHPRPSNYVEF
jgi:hypothetical protein